MALTIPATIADVTDLAALSAALGPATQAEARALVPGQSDAALVKSGNRIATPRVDDDALRLLRGAATFYATAPSAVRARVNLSPDFLRVAAWSALQGHDAWTSIAKRTAQSGTRDATRAVQSADALSRSRALRDQLAETVALVGGTPAWRVKVTAAVRPGAAGMPEARADVGLASLVALGRELLASKKADVKQRVALYSLTAAKLDEADAVAAQTATIVGKAKAPRTVARQSPVDLWDGLNLAILEQVTRAFTRESAVDPAVPSLGFVSLRSRASAKGKVPPGTAKGTSGTAKQTSGTAKQTSGSAPQTSGTASPPALVTT